MPSKNDTKGVLTLVVWFTWFIWFGPKKKKIVLVHLAFILAFLTENLIKPNMPHTHTKKKKNLLKIKFIHYTVHF